MITVTEAITKKRIVINVAMIGALCDLSAAPGPLAIDRTLYPLSAFIETLTGKQIVTSESSNTIRDMIHVEEYRPSPIINRIGDRCWYRPPGQAEWRRGLLRHWSTDHEEYTDGPGQMPVGVIEDEETARMHSIHVNLITFGAQPQF